MGVEKLIGRTEEIKRLDRCMSEEQAQLIIVYGRWRVGKTYLISQYFNGAFSFSFTGSYKESRKKQLVNFAKELSVKQGKNIEAPKDWTDAFFLLRGYLSSLKEGKKIVFFDEMPWMDTQRSGFLGAFEYFWNHWGSKQDNLVFIACGSATSWMIRNIDENKGGLFNRQTCKLFLKHFNLAMTEKMLLSKGIQWERYDIALCYMIMGGYPYYLNLLSPELTLSENIDYLFFRERGELWDEFDHLYNTLFSNSEKYVKVITALSRKAGGMTRSELVETTKLPDGGGLTKVLKNLIDSGFVRLSSFYNQKSKDSIYQLCDYYTMFYFKFIRDQNGQDENYWKNTTDLPARRVWAGLTFEMLCKDHISQIKKKLSIGGVYSKTYSWFHYPSKDDDEEDDEGAQIDMLIDRRDNTINVCEAKFSHDKYVIDKEYSRNLRKKIEVFRRVTKSNKTLILTMITGSGVKKNMYSGIVSSQVTLDDLFEDV